MSQRYAVLIGNSLFPDEPKLLPLRCPPQDVEALADLLGSDEHGPYLITRVVNEDNAAVRRNTFRILRNATPEDLVLVYYSGHGKLDEDGNLHLATKDTTIEDLPTSSFAIDELRRYMKSSRSSKIVVVLDCCFSGAVGELFGFRGDAASQATRVVSEQLRGSGTYILTASTDTQRAEERESDQYGLLTKHILSGIGTGAADLDDDGVVSMHELLTYVQREVAAEGRQRPQGYALNVEGGDLALARTGKPARWTRRQTVLNCVYETAAKCQMPTAIVKSALFVVDGCDGSEDVRSSCERQFDELYRRLQYPAQFIERLWDLPRLVADVERVSTDPLLRSQIERVNHELNVRAAENAKLAEELVAARATAEHLQQNLDEQRELNAQLQTELQTFERRLDSATSTEARLSAQIESLDQQRVNERDKLNAQVSALKEQLRIEQSRPKPSDGVSLPNAVATAAATAPAPQFTPALQAPTFGIPSKADGYDKPRVDLGTGEAAHVVSLLTTFRSGKDCFVAPGIPKVVSAAARACCAVPENETLLGVVDCSGNGSASKAVVFGVDRLYFCTGGEPESIDYPALPEDPKRIQVEGGIVLLPAGKQMDLRKSSMSAGALREMLLKL